jgi:UDP-N-acetyl-D-mannosaminuronic acid dehydrogenase
VILTDHDEYLTLEPETLASRMRRPNVVDTRGLIDRAEWEAAGFGVHVLGDGRRSPIDSPTDE